MFTICESFLSLKKALEQTRLDNLQRGLQRHLCPCAENSFPFYFVQWIDILTLPLLGHLRQPFDALEPYNIGLRWTGVAEKARKIVLVVTIDSLSIPIVTSVFGFSNTDEKVKILDILEVFV